MLNYALFIQLNKFLLGFSSLTDSINKNAFTEDCMRYLDGLRSFADEHGLYISADIALAEQKIMTFKSENTAKTTATKRHERQERLAFSVACLDELRRVLNGFLEKDRKTYEECRDLWRQVAARLLLNLPPSANGAPPDADKIIALLKTDAELSAYYAHIVGQVGNFNARALLETVLPELGII